MIGTTGIKGLRIDCIVGIYAHERRDPQTVELDIELDYDFTAAARSDAISNAIDYDLVAAGVATLLHKRQFQLLEAMAEEAVTWLLERFVAVRAVRLEIRKPAAVPAAVCSFVRIARGRA